MDTPMTLDALLRECRLVAEIDCLLAEVGRLRAENLDLRDKHRAELRAAAEKGDMG